MDDRLLHRELSSQVLGCAIAVHSQLGPGLLENAYRACLGFELACRGLQYKQEVPIPLNYGGVALECGFRADFIVEGTIVLEIKAVESLLPIHEAQLLTYLKLSGHRVGLLINFNATSLRKGLRRLVR